MVKYIVEMQMDKQEKFYFIRENESGDINTFLLNL